MSFVTVDEQYDDSFKCVNWKVDFKNKQYGETVANFRLTRFNSISHYKVLCTYYSRIFTQPDDSNLIGSKYKCQFDIELSLEEVNINGGESTSRKDNGNKTVSDNYNSPCDVWVTANEGETHFLKKMPSSVYWKSEVFRLSVPINNKKVNFKIWIKFHIFGDSEMKALKNLSDYLFVDQTDCDVQFSFEDGRQIGAHKKILSAMSPVFAAMFKHDMLEAKTGQVAIKDIDLEIFKELLHFIYLGRISEPLNENKAQPLLLAADRYEILDLKEDCSRKLISSIELRNAIGLLIWAHNNSVEKVKQAAIDVVVQNAKKICQQTEWEMLTLLHPDLCLLATRRMVT